MAAHEVFTNRNKYLTNQITNELTPWQQNPKVHHHIHKSLPLVPILSQMNPIYTLLANLPFWSHPPTYAMVFMVLYPSGFPTKIL
jgi:hypothetical protein